MNKSESLKHADCGGNVRRDPKTKHYICDRCSATAEGVISAGEKVEGQPELVTLCNLHDEAF